MIKPVFRNNNYLVSDESIVWSRYIIGGKGQVGKIWRRMRLNHDSYGYLQVSLMINYVNTMCALHRLIYEAFTEKEIPKGLLVRHFDDNFRNNLFSNLFLGTYQDNKDDAKSNGRVANGERVNTAQLNETQVIEIRYLLESKTPKRDISEMFGVSLSCVQHISKNRTWQHVK